MPIRPDLRRFYGKEWHTIQRPRIMARANNKCEDCGRPHRQYVDTITGRQDGQAVMFWATPEGNWLDNDGNPARMDYNTLLGLCNEAFSFMSPQGETMRIRSVRSIITIAHLDHNPENCDDDNLKALCQWCHLNYDKQHHASSRAIRKDAARPLLQNL